MNVHQKIITLPEDAESRLRTLEAALGRHMSYPDAGIQFGMTGKEFFFELTKARRAAGMEPINKTEKILAALEQGETEDSEIAMKCGATAAYVRTVAIGAGYAKPRVKAVDKLRAAAGQGGKTIAQLAAECGTTEAYARKVIEDNDIPYLHMRRRGVTRPHVEIPSRKPYSPTQTTAVVKSRDAVMSSIAAVLNSTQDRSKLLEDLTRLFMGESRTTKELLIERFPEAERGMLKDLSESTLRAIMRDRKYA